MRLVLEDDEGHEVDSEEMTREEVQALSDTMQDLRYDAPDFPSAASEESIASVELLHGLAEQA